MIFSRKNWKGYAWIPMKDNGDLILWTEPRCTLFENQDVALSTMVLWVHFLDQFFLAYGHPETHLYRQIQFLEKFHPELHKRFIKERNAARSKAQRLRNRQNFSRRNVGSDGLKGRNAAKENKKPQPLAQLTQSPKSTDAQSLVHPPMNPIQAPVQKPITTPTQELSQYQRKVRAEHQALWDCVRDRAESSSCEDFDK